MCTKIQVSITSISKEQKHHASKENLHLDNHNGVSFLYLPSFPFPAFQLLPFTAVPIAEGGKGWG